VNRANEGAKETYGREVKTCGKQAAANDTKGNAAKCKGEGVKQGAAKGVER